MTSRGFSDGEPTDRECRIAAYVTGDLPADERAALERAMAGDAELAREVASMCDAAERVRALPVAEASPGLADAVMARIAAAPANGGGRGGERRLPLVLGGAAAWRRMAALALIAALSAAVIARAVRRGREPAAEREDAVSGALAWLERTQEPAGGWNPVKWGGKPEFEVSLTGMSLLALMELRGQGQSESARSAARRAAGFLLTRQNADGSIGPGGEAALYNHGIATVALLRSYLADPQQRVKAALDSALQFICRAQSASGGWGYTAGTDREPNTSLSVWQIQALMLGERAGWTFPAHNLQRGLRWLDGMASSDGTFGYHAAGDSASRSDGLTAMAASCLFPARAGRAPDDGSDGPLRRAVARIGAGSGAVSDFYSGYFVASALATGADPAYDRFLARMQRSLLDRRTRDATLRGTWDPADRWGGAGGRVYATAMAALSLCKSPQG
jgi:hypothetical protein